MSKIKRVIIAVVIFATLSALAISVAAAPIRYIQFDEESVPLNQIPAEPQSEAKPLRGVVIIKHASIAYCTAANDNLAYAA